MWTAILGALAGAVKGKQDEQAWRDQQNFEATRERYSPWTGMHGQYAQKPSKMGAMLQGFMAGWGMGQQMKGKDGQQGQKAYTGKETPSTQYNPNNQNQDISFSNNMMDENYLAMGPQQQPRSNLWAKGW